MGGTKLRVGVGSSMKSKTKKGDRLRHIPEVLQPIIADLVLDRPAHEPLFMTATEGGFHTKSWLLAAAKRFCRDAGVPYVCPHGLKGTSGTLLAEAGALADQIAEHLSHERQSTTRTSYVAEGALANAEAQRAFQVIAGGRR